MAVLSSTEQGSTRDIAEFIAADLAQRGADAHLHDIEHAPAPEGFDAVILGSAVHDMDFPPPAVAYPDRYRTTLATTDVRLFGVGPGPALRGPIGRIVPETIADMVEAAR